MQSRGESLGGGKPRAQTLQAPNQPTNQEGQAAGNHRHPAGTGSGQPQALSGHGQQANTGIQQA